jgi:hypothetical protein
MAYLLGAFMFGGAVGYAADRSLVKPPSTIWFEQPSVVETLTHELQLRADQRAVFDSVWAWRRTRSSAIMAPVKPALDSTRDSARVLMMNSLDSNQQAAFRLLIERQQRAADSTARTRG